MERALIHLAIAVSALVLVDLVFVDRRNLFGAFVEVVLLAWVAWTLWNWFWDWKDRTDNEQGVGVTTMGVIFIIAALVLGRDQMPPSEWNIIAYGLLPFFLIGMGAIYWYKNRPAPPDTRYLEWIDNHSPALPEPAKTEYKKAAEEVVNTYQEQRYGFTTNKLYLAEREKETPLKLEEVQSLLFNEYKKLAPYTKPDDLPSFALMPVRPDLHDALVKLASATYKVKPWGYDPNLSPEEEEELQHASLDQAFAKSPFARTAIALIR